jgi:hypothetical protein
MANRTRTRGARRCDRVIGAAVTVGAIPWIAIADLADKQVQLKHPAALRKDSSACNRQSSRMAEETGTQQSFQVEGAAKGDIGPAGRLLLFDAVPRGLLAVLVAGPL